MKHFVCMLDDILPNAGVCALIEGQQIAIFRVDDAVFAIDNLDPASGVNALSRGIVGDVRGELVVASPLYKQHYSLKTGRCIEDPRHAVNAYDTELIDGQVWISALANVVNTVRTTCPYCGVGCGVVATRTEAGALIAGDSRHPANQGRLCTKGVSLGETLGIEGRLLHPRLHDQTATWDEALNHVAEGFSRVIREHGPDAVAFYVSGQLLTEDYYVANKLMKGFIGSANIDTNSRLCMSSAVAGHKRAFGADVMPVSYEDLEQADLIVLVGSNTAWCHPVLFRRISEAKERRPEMRVVVIDPRRTPTCELADLHLPVRSGSDVMLFNGLLAYLSLNGFSDTAFIENHTRDAEQAVLIAKASAPDIKSVADACRLDVGDLETFFHLFATTERVITAFSQGVNQSSSGTDKVNSIINCHLLTGRIGRSGMGPFSITGQPNAMGGREVGGMANMLAAHMDLENADHRALVGEFWKSDRVAAKPGLKAVELFEAIHDGRIKAVWIMATNPVVSLPDADRVREALARCPLVVVSDCVERTDTTALAHVLLPAAAWGEKDGCVTNSERRISRQRAFITPPENVKPDWWMICEVAKRMGFADAFAFSAAHEIFDEHARLSGFGNQGDRAFDISGLAGLSVSRYASLEPTQWPLTHQQPLSEHRPFADGRFFFADGRARFIPTTPRPPVHATDRDFPLSLNTGRVRDQWHTMTRTGLSPKLAAHLPEPFADLHPQDALTRGLQAGELVRVSTRWGSIVVRLSTGGEIARGDVFVPIHWASEFGSDARVGAVVNPVVDAISGEPEFKHTPANVEPFPVEWYGLVMTRQRLDLAPLTWWALSRGKQCFHYEVAGRAVPRDWVEWTRRLLTVPVSGSDYFDSRDLTGDPAAALYRGAWVVDGRLEACAFFSKRPVLTSRAWVAGLFEKELLEERDRLAVLAGVLPHAPADGGKVVCACFGVGRSTISEAIAAHRLVTVKQVGRHLRAGTHCGSCTAEISSLLRSAQPPRG